MNPPELFATVATPVAGRWRVFLRYGKLGAVPTVGGVDVEACSESEALRAAIAAKFTREQARALKVLSAVSITRLQR